MEGEKHPITASTYVAFRVHSLETHGINPMLRTLCSHGIERNFSIVELKTTQLTKGQVEWLYDEHDGKDFFPKLVDSMSSGPVCLVRVEFTVDSEEGIDEFIKDFRENVVGATDPRNAKPGTLRYLYGDKEAYAKGFPFNACHSPSNRKAIHREMPMLFGGNSQISTTLCWT